MEPDFLRTYQQGNSPTPRRRGRAKAFLTQASPRLIRAVARGQVSTIQLGLMFGLTVADLAFLRTR